MISHEQSTSGGNKCGYVLSQLRFHLLLERLTVVPDTLRCFTTSLRWQDVGHSASTPPLRLSHHRHQQHLLHRLKSIHTPATERGCKHALQLRHCQVPAASSISTWLSLNTIQPHVRFGAHLPWRRLSRSPRSSAERPFAACEKNKRRKALTSVSTRLQ